MIDYCELLQKYLAHVIDCEGWTFLENLWPEDGTFTPDELAELRRLADEVDA